jgi:hypothetical protein
MTQSIFRLCLLKKMSGRLMMKSKDVEGGN